MNLDLFRLRVFAAVVEHNGYSAAARALNLAQPTVSHHVSELTRTCGAELLQYRQRNVHVTAAGQEVYRAALSMLAEQQQLTVTLSDLALGRRGRVRLGASIAFEQKYFVGRVIAPFCRAYNGTLLSLRFGHSRREAQAVLDRELDLAFVIRWHLPVKAPFEYVHDIELVFLASHEHPLAAAGQVTLEDIAAAGLISAPLNGAESGFYGEILRKTGLSGDHTVMELDGQQARFLAAAAGLGVLATFVPAHALDTIDDSLVRLPVDCAPARAEVGLVCHDGHPLSSNTRALAAWLRARRS